MILNGLRRLAARLRLGSNWLLLLVATGIGLLMGAVATAFIVPLHRIEILIASQDSATLAWLIPMMPVGGALLAGAVIYLMPVDGEGPGVTRVMYAIYRKKSQLPFRLAIRKWIASTLTIGSGGSAGAEGPIVTIGSVIGATIARGVGMNAQGTATLLGCGAAAGIASVFNAPIAGVFFVMEILLRDFSLRTFTPIVVASVISAAFTQALLGGNDALFATADSFAVDAFTVLEIPNYLVLGLICGVVAALFVRGIYASSRWFERLPVHRVVRPAIGGGMLGLLGLISLTVLDNAHGVPGFYGNGYPVITQLLDPRHYYEPSGALLPAGTFLTAVVALGLLKGVATALTLGSGGAGGLFAPSLLIGAAVGGTLGYVVNLVGWFPSASPAHYSLVGMAAMVAASTHAPLTGILIVYEITRSYEIILPLMLAAVISTIVARLVYRESVYTVRLTDAGVRVGSMSDLTILRRLYAQDVPLDEAVTVRGDESAQRLLELSEDRSITDFIVVNERGEYRGLVTSADLKAALVYREAIPLLQVHELLRTDLPTVHPEDSLDIVLDKFARHDVQSLAVIDGRTAPRILGLITRERLMRTYQTQLTEE